MRCRWTRSQLEAEIILQGGDPDRLDNARVGGYCGDGLDIFEAAGAEAHRQVREDVRAREERMERGRVEDEERRYYEDRMQAEHEAAMEEKGQ